MSHSVVGRSVPRKDAYEKVTGRAQYTVDLSLPRMGHGVCVRSDVAHGRITAIDVAAALAAPGVLAVVTGQDILDRGLFPRYGHAVVDHPVLAIDKVRFVGEPVALVVAETAWQAAQAAELVSVEIDELPRAVTLDEALAPNAPAIHEDDYGLSESRFIEDDALDTSAEPNVLRRIRHGWGDVDAAEAEADIVVGSTFRYPMTYGYAMEPYNALAWVQGGAVTVWSTAQHPYMVRSEVARILGWPLSSVRIVVPYIGGGYGTKSFTKVEPLAVVGALATGRPVKVVLSIDESMLTTRAESAVIHGRTGFRSTGEIVFRGFDIAVDAGAYADSSPLVAGKMANRCSGPYRIPNLLVECRTVYTNTIPASSLRGFGGPQGVFAGESLMDMGAEALGLDQYEIRRRNLASRGEVFFPGKRALDSDLDADVKEVEAASEPVDTEPREGSGIGFALAATDPGDKTPVSNAAVRIHADGSVSLLSGSTEMGQGSRTVLSQIVAEELGVDLGHIHVVQSDTGAGPYERTTGASRTTTLTGLALQRAVADARMRVLNLARDVWSGDVRLVSGGVTVDGEFHGYSDVIQGWFGTSGGEVLGYGATRGEGTLSDIPVFWEIGMVRVRVDVDLDTYALSVSELTTLGDCGFAVNPALVRGQDEGSALGGLGASLAEEIVYEGSEPVNGTIIDYRVPRITDWPDRVDSLIAQRGDGVGPYGARGSGEGAVHPMGAAVAAAVARATGVRATELPITSERLWRLATARGAHKATTTSRETGAARRHDEKEQADGR